ncbi:MAG: hypothetical protein Q7T76_22260 [Ferruginibacter sp.]|nr:hypothetical protein [Ferruginibacter sp.]
MKNRFITAYVGKLCFEYRTGATVFLCFLFLSFNPFALFAQAECILQHSMLKIDFGNRNKQFELNTSLVKNYNLIDGYCPQDGNYAIVPATRDCFNGHWFSVNQDHTPGDIEGNMLLVNASYEPGLFYSTALKGVLPNTTYEFGAWMLNVCWAGNNCTPIRPNVRFIIKTVDGQELAKFSTGEMPPSGGGAWLQYTARFTTPASTGILLLLVETKGPGGCGNDFALDDITLQECKVPIPPTKEKPPIVKSPVRKPLPPVQKQPPPAAVPVPKQIPPTVSRVSIKDTLMTNKPAPSARPAFVPVPAPLLSRSNPVIKRIEFPAGELVIDLYDNGEIDGDTVTIYHNNVLLVSRAALSAKSVSFRIPINADHPHHELVMVANNLGSIPPNTSLMVLTAKNRRHEVFISSSEQKNAKIVIDLKE